MALGTDIVKISRIQRLTENKIPQKIFTANEAQYINSKKDKLQTCAGIFAAKEAVLKALKCGITMPLCEVEILHDKKGAPCVNLLGSLKEYAQIRGVLQFEISISHDGEYATSVAYAKEDKFLKYYVKALEKLKNAPKDAIVTDMISKLLPKRPMETHKGSYGRLYVLAGSTGLTGAAIMACTSALKSGAGLITLGCAKELNTIFEMSLKEVMTKPVKSKNGIITSHDTKRIINEIQSSNVCLIGPGLGRNDEVTKTIKNIFASQTSTPLVIDADGLYAISEDKNMLKSHCMPLVLTPHIGEFATLTGISKEEILLNPQKHAAEFAKKHNVVLVLKSHRTVVASPDGELFVNVLGNPGMATGGTGDVLSGIIASFFAQGLTPLKASLAGVYIHSLAADMAVSEYGEYSLTPSNIMDYIPYAIKYTQIQAKETL